MGSPIVVLEGRKPYTLEARLQPWPGGELQDSALLLLRGTAEGGGQLSSRACLMVKREALRAFAEAILAELP